MLILGLLQATRSAVLFGRRSFLAELGLALPLPYATAAAAIWGGLLVAAAVGLWRMRPWGRWLALVAVTGSLAHSWIDQALFARSDYAQLTAGCTAGMAAFVVGLTWVLLWWPSIRRRF